MECEVCCGRLGCVLAAFAEAAAAVEYRLPRRQQHLGS